jgi:hypothetical protein
MHSGKRNGKPIWWILPHADMHVDGLTKDGLNKRIYIFSNIRICSFRLRNHGGRTSNGDGGVSSVKGPDGTNFIFSNCSLSFNGTNPTRGQLPQILYYSSPQENDDDVQSATRSMAELYARRTALSMTATIVKTVTTLLVTARDSIDGEKGLQVRRGGRMLVGHFNQQFLFF